MKKSLSKRIACGLLLGSTSLSMLSIGQSAFGAERAAPYEMAVIIDAAHGHKVQKGEYAKAITRLADAKRRFPDEFARQNNLCVAYTKTGDLDRAEQACDAAVEFVESKGVRAVKGFALPDVRENAYRVYKAIALSNRGVVRALQGDVKFALRDFEQANDLKARVRGPKSNLARLSKTVASSS